MPSFPRFRYVPSRRRARLFTAIVLISVVLILIVLILIVLVLILVLIVVVHFNLSCGIN